MSKHEKLIKQLSSLIYLIIVLEMQNIISFINLITFHYGCTRIHWMHLMRENPTPLLLLSAWEKIPMIWTSINIFQTKQFFSFRHSTTVMFIWLGEAIPREWHMELTVNCCVLWFRCVTLLMWTFMEVPLIYLSVYILLLLLLTWLPLLLLLVGYGILCWKT